MSASYEIHYKSNNIGVTHIPLPCSGPSPHDLVLLLLLDARRLLLRELVKLGFQVVHVSLQGGVHERPLHIRSRDGRVSRVRATSHYIEEVCDEDISSFLIQSEGPPAPAEVDLEIRATRYNWSRRFSILLGFVLCQRWDEYW